MTSEHNYKEINKKSWNAKTDFHYESEFYDVKGFLQGKSSLNEIELNLLGNIEGKSILHLQCHFGQDTISLARLGAKVTGVDLSDKSIQRANELALKTNTQVEFICCDIYELPKHLDKQFDIVYTSYGVIGWLPDLYKWAQVISKYLKKGGKFIFAEFHPVVWMFDDNFEHIHYEYLNSGAIVETLSGTYAEKDAEIEAEYVMWNHGIGEVVSNLIRNGIQIKALDEFNYSPYDCFNKTIEFEPKKYRIKHLGSKIPMIYSILGEK